uniref:Large ribosomal subunit protein bL21m n=1 Tax=Sus scrofa TaxID=9823 RepID=A0A8D0MJ22_PIG
MAAAVAASVLQGTFGRLVSACSRSVLRTSRPGTAPPWSAPRRLSSQHTSSLRGCVPKTSLGSPPWPDIVLPDPVEETRHHAEVVGQVNELIAAGRYGRLFAVVHFASHQWKVTAEDLILIENELDVACGETQGLAGPGWSGQRGRRSPRPGCAGSLLARPARLSEGTRVSLGWSPVSSECPSRTASGLVLVKTPVGMQRPQAPVMRSSRLFQLEAPQDRCPGMRPTVAMMQRDTRFSLQCKIPPSFASVGSSPVYTQGSVQLLSLRWSPSPQSGHDPRGQRGPAASSAPPPATPVAPSGTRACLPFRLR